MKCRTKSTASCVPCGGWGLSWQRFWSCSASCCCSVRSRSSCGLSGELRSFWGWSGIVEILDYLSTSALFRQSLTIVRGLFDLLIAVLLLRADAEMVITVFAVLLGVSAIVIGIHKLDYAMKLNYFRVEGSGMAIAGGVLSVIAGICFLISPLSSAIVLTTLIAAYCIPGRHRIVHRNAFL